MKQSETVRKRFDARPGNRQRRFKHVLKAEQLDYDYCIIALKNPRSGKDSISSVEYELMNLHELYRARVKKWEHIETSTPLDDYVLENYGFTYRKVECDQGVFSNEVIISSSIPEKLKACIRPEAHQRFHFEIFLLRVGRGIMKNYAVQTGMKVYDNINHFLARYDDRQRKNYEKFRTVEK